METPSDIFAFQKQAQPTPRIVSIDFFFKLSDHSIVTLKLATLSEDLMFFMKMYFFKYEYRPLIGKKSMSDKNTYGVTTFSSATFRNKFIG